GGDIDPGALFYLQRVANLTPEEVEAALNRQSGLKGLCGAGDMRHVLAKVQSGDGAAELALDIYVRRIRQYIGGYLALLGRADALVFTGGVGENSAAVRALVCQGMAHLGIRLDSKRNATATDDAITLSCNDSPIEIVKIRTNEELQIA